MKNLIIILLLALVLNGSGAIMSYANSGEQAAIDRVYTCLSKYVVTYDDGRTDAHVIANAVVNRCENESAAYVNILIRGA
ncbi:MAG: hypothetical protein PF495_11040, partial [Spirochaetales bacterium]|nr:hypothetical protein [Spirochaetales bacterium]